MVANYALKTYTITPSISGNGSGTLTPNSPQTLNCGSDKTFTFAPASSSLIYKLLVDGVNIADSIPVGSYTFENITANHTIEVIFKTCDTIIFNWQGGTSKCFNISATNGEDFVINWGDSPDLDTLTATGSGQSISYGYPGNSIYTVNIIGMADCYFKSLQVAGLGLTTLDLSNTFTLQVLYCENNQLSKLILSAGGLNFIQCFNNRLQLSDLFAISEMILNASNKRLGTQTLPAQTAKVGDVLFASQSVFNGIFTEYVVTQGGTPVPTSDYTVTNGTIIFHVAGIYDVIMTNSAIISHPTYPAKTMLQLTIDN